MSADVTIEDVLVPDLLPAAGARLLERGLELLAEAAELTRQWERIEGCVDVLRPHCDNLADDEIAEAWNEVTGVLLGLDVLMEIANVISDGTNCGVGPARPRHETRTMVAEWRRRYVR